MAPTLTPFPLCFCRKSTTHTLSYSLTFSLELAPHTTHAHSFNFSYSPIHSFCHSTYILSLDPLLHTSCALLAEYSYGPSLTILNVYSYALTLSTASISIASKNDPPKQEHLKELKESVEQLSKDLCMPVLDTSVLGIEGVMSLALKRLLCGTIAGAISSFVASPSVATKGYSRARRHFYSRGA